MGLELPGDERVRSADEMEDFDNLAVARHGPARGEPDRRAHGQNHEGEKSGGEDDDRVGHCPDARRPDAMIVEIGLRHRSRQSRSQRREVLGALAAESDDDEARDRQLAEVESGAEPWLEKLFQFGFRIGVSILDAWRL